MTATYCFAQVNIEINSIYDRVHQYCAGYETDAAPDFTVTITEEDLIKEREYSVRNRLKEGIQATKPSDEYLEELAVYRKICEKMPFYDRFLFHGSCIALDGAGYLFTAPSGTGKSTHARLWREVFGERVVMVNDDKPLIGVNPPSKEGDKPEIIVCGTPWNGKHRLSENIAVPLKAICLLKRGEKNSIIKVDVAQILPNLLGQSYRPADKAALERVLKLTENVTKSVNTYILYCNMDPEAAIVAQDRMANDD